MFAALPISSLTKFEAELQLLHKAEKYAVKWLEFSVTPEFVK